MNIGFVTMDLQLGGGAEHDVVNLSTGLKRAGHGPIVITSGGRLCEYVEAENIPVLRHPVDRRSPVRLWQNAPLVARAVEQHDIEALNPQGVYPVPTCYWASRQLLKRGRFVPNVVTIHVLGKLKWWYYKLGATLLNRYADHVIFESQFELDRVLRHGFRGPYTVIPNCSPPARQQAVVETREQIRQEIGVPPDAVLFVMPARMTWEKRHDLLLESLARPEVRSLPIRFYLAGDGPLADRYRRQARALGVEDRVIFGGFRKDLPRLYKAADVFLLCSAAESLPLSIREGMGASLPVIATDVGGIVEAVEHEGSGLLVPSGDAAALAGAIGRLASDAGLRRRMGERGYQIYQEKFDYDHWIARTVQIMSEVREKFIREHS